MTSYLCLTYSEFTGFLYISTCGQEEEEEGGEGNGWGCSRRHGWHGGWCWAV